LGATPALRPGLRFRAALPELIWNTAALEGNTYTLPEVRTLLEGASVGGRSLQETEQILALREASRSIEPWIISSAATTRPNWSACCARAPRPMR